MKFVVADEMLPDKFLYRLHASRHANGRKKTGNTSASTVGVLANNLRTPDEKKNPAFNASDWEELREDG